MIHYFDIDIAKEYGINQAIIFQNIAYWIAHNKANKINFHDGRYWTFNSAKAMQELFPYMTPRQIKYALEKLEADGLIVTGNYNSMPFDRTLWYALTDKGESILQSREMHFTNLLNGNDDFVKPIPNNKPNINTDKKETNKEKDFERFWKAYPRKVNKAKAKAAFMKANVDIETLINAVENAKKSHDWQKDNGQYIPHPTTYLNGERWNDELTISNKPQRSEEDERFLADVFGEIL